MRIIKFSASKVHDNYNFNVNFRKDINFLVGVNGSGKTTALRLIQAALLIDLSTLFSVKFAHLSICIATTSGKQIEMKIINEKSHLKFLVNGQPAETVVNVISDEKRNLYAKSDRLEEHIEEQRMLFLNSAGELFREFLHDERPLFLGLERRAGRYEHESFYYDDDMEGKAYFSSRRMGGRQVLEGLDNCQRLIERAYRKYRRLSDSANSRFINVIVDSLFDYHEFNPETWAPTGPGPTDFQLILNRRKEIEKFAQDLGGNRTATNKINHFFSKISGAQRSEEGGGINIEWLLNKAQLSRIHSLLVEMDKQKKAAERLYSPIAEFEIDINKFFFESNKILHVDPLGKLKVSQNGGEVSLAALSSGEKQLLILLAHSRFSRSAGGVIIVDEPELSLHPAWQEMLIDALMPGVGQRQFIFATHSPEIVGYRTESCVDVR